MVSIDDLYNVIFFIWGWSDLVQNHNDMSTAVIWSKSKLDVEFQYSGRLGELHGCHPRATRHVAGCCHLVNSLSWFQPHATLQGAVTWRNQCHDRATLQGVIIPSAILKIVIRQCFFFFFKCSLGFNERRLLYRLRYTCCVGSIAMLIGVRQLHLVSVLWNCQMIVVLL